jgi:hypothetical protein
MGSEEVGSVSTECFENCGCRYVNQYIVIKLLGYGSYGKVSLAFSATRTQKHMRTNDDVELKN